MKMTNDECREYLGKASTWKDYSERYTFLARNVPTDLKKAGSWAQIESFPHLMFQLMHSYKGLRWWSERGFII